MLKAPMLRSASKEHMMLYVFVCVLFLVGVVFGSVMVNALTVDQKTELTRYVGNFFQTVNGGLEVDHKVSFQQAFSMHVKWIVLIWVLGMSIIGMPIIMLLNFLKGVLVGFTVGYLVQHWQWKGMLFALASVAPQNMVLVPALIICSVSALSFSLYVIKHTLIQRNGTVYEPFVKYTTTAVGMVFLMAGIALFESYLSPTLMQWVTPMLLN